jgi:hypothetical protein
MGIGATGRPTGRRSFLRCARYVHWRRQSSGSLSRCKRKVPYMTPVSSAPAESDEQHTTEPPPWQQTFIAEDGSVFYDTDARRSPSKHFAQEEAEHEARLRRLTPIARRTYMTYKRTGVLLPLLAPRPQARPRSSRGPAPIRYKGSRRSGTRSPPSSSDDDPHESDPDDLGHRRPVGGRR